MAPRNERFRGRPSLRTQQASRQATLSNANDSGSAIVIALIGAALLIASGVILASRSLWYQNKSVKGSAVTNARDAAEYGAAAITEQLNSDSNSYLLVVQPACWQLSAQDPTSNPSGLDETGLSMPPGVHAGPDKVKGVISNTDSSKQWGIIPLVSGQSEASAVSSGTYARYQLIKYIPPLKPGTTESDVSPFSGACPSGNSAKFANRYGGSAELTIHAEFYRKGQLASEQTIRQEVHVKGALVSSLGEPSVVLMSAADLTNIELFLDANNNLTKEDSEPWLDIMCLFCTSTTQAGLKAEIGLVNGSQYAGTIYTGKFKFPTYPFYDANSNGYYDEGSDDKTIPLDLHTALAAKNTTWTPSALTYSSDTAVTLDTNQVLSSITAPSVPVYGSESGSSSTGAKVDISFCQKNKDFAATSSAPACTSSNVGDISQITINTSSSSLISSDLSDYSSSTNSGTGWVKIGDICSAIKGTKPSWCTSSAGTRIKINIVFTPSNPLNNLVSLNTGIQHYPFALDNSGSIGHLTNPSLYAGDAKYRRECAEATSNFDAANPYTYIGCVVSDINFDSGNPSATIIVDTWNTNGKPVYIFVQRRWSDPSKKSDGDIAMDVGSQQQLINNKSGDSTTTVASNDPESLALFGLPPKVPDGSATSSATLCQTNQDQLIVSNGNGNIKGFWMWFPRGYWDASTGNTSASGILWLCNWNGKGNFRFMGANQNVTQGLCGDIPCGLYIYRAQGIAELERQ